MATVELIYEKRVVVWDVNTQSQPLEVFVAASRGVGGIAASWKDVYDEEDEYGQVRRKLEERSEVISEVAAGIHESMSIADACRVLRGTDGMQALKVNGSAIWSADADDREQRSKKAADEATGAAVEVENEIAAIIADSGDGGFEEEEDE